MNGLTKESGRWVDDAFRNPGVKIHLDVKGGIGAIHITAE